VVTGRTANLRAGPGTAYDVVGVASEGDTLRLLARTADGGWWQVAYQEQAVWVYAGIVTSNRTPIEVPVASEIPPTPTPAVPAAGATRVRETDGMVVVYVPAGEVQMGSVEGDSDELPVHTVYLDAFWIDRTEATNAQYRRCVEAGACEIPDRCNFGSPSYTDAARSDHPVACVNWSGAARYCAWVGARQPTEAEWEYAARGPEGKRYPWGDTFDCALGNFDDETLLSGAVVAGGEGCDGYPRTAPVGSFPGGASWCGAFDLSGNVREWVEDWYGAYLPGQQANPAGPAYGDYKVVRGGGWYVADPHVLRGADRAGNNPGDRNENLGFRCATDSG